ncbi:MAG: glycosyltransferase family 4 protein [Bacteroidales bacterium]|jgi:glycosyltransferase involved in cell wall biosynthesis|nr:glycosyltransferase family 4 protein [Bacteroidales bacterium]
MPEKFVSFGSMRILMINYEYPPVGGGAGVIAKHIAEGLVGLGHEVHVISVRFGDLPDSTEENGVQVTRLKSKRKYACQSNPLEMLSWMRIAKKFLRRHLKQESYDVCFAHFALPGGEVAYSMNLEFGLPYVVMSHGHDLPWFFPKQMWFYHTLTYFWIRKIVLNSKALFVQSDVMETNARLFLGKQKSKLIKQIPNGWDADFYFPDFSKKSDTFTLLFPGRLVKQKDPFTVLKAVQRLNTEISDLKLRVLGDGPLRKPMEAWVKSKNLQNTVCFEGWMDKVRMRDAYQTCSMVVLPSLNEGMSMATLEAMACGTYVVVTDVSRNTLLVKPGVNGLIIGMQDDKALAEAILDYYTENHLNDYQVPQSSIDKLSEIYSWDTVVKQYDEVLSELKGEK